LPIPPSTFYDSLVMISLLHNGTLVSEVHGSAIGPASLLTTMSFLWTTISHDTLLSAVACVVSTAKVHGVLPASIAFLSSGLHSTCAKLAGPRTAAVVYLSYLALATFLASTLGVVIIDGSIAFNGYGLAAGTLLMSTLIFGINAIWIIGLAWGDLTAASTAALASFLAGRVAFHEGSSHRFSAIAAFAILFVGIFGLARVVWSRVEQLAPVEQSALLRAPTTNTQKAAGFAFSIVAGVLCGLSFLMSKLTTSSTPSTFVWSQSLGMVCTMAVICAVSLMCDAQTLQSKDAHEDYRTLVYGRWEPARLLPLAFAQGCLLAACNVATVYAASSPLGLSVAQPARECGHIIPVLLGAFVFREFGDLEFTFTVSLLLMTAMNIGALCLLFHFG